MAKKPKVIITSASRKVELVRIFKEFGWYVIAQDIDPFATALKFANKIDSSDYIAKWLEADLIVPTRDAELVEWAGRAPYVMVPSFETVETCTDKYKFYKWCKANGFKTPEVYFVKPRVSKSGKETECVWQEFVEAEEYSVDLFSDFQSNVISIVPRKRIKVVAGESWVSETVSNAVITKSAKKLAEKLNLIGHNVLQCFLGGGEPIWTDVNCRFGGGSALAIKAGCHSPLWLKQLLDNQTIKPCIGDYEVGLRMFSYKESIFENANHR